MSELVQLKGLTGKAADEPHTHEEGAHAEPDAAQTLATLRTRLSGKRGKAYWRSLEELAESEQFIEALHREFPENASEWTDPVGRRRFMRLMGASLALAGLTACTKQPPEYFAPYAKQPEEITLGRPLFFATAMPFAGSSIGLLAESHEGRPTKIEGNKDHPASLGATDLFAQASVLDLYDPDRLQTITNVTDPATWSDFINAVRATVTQQRAPELAGTGLRILSEVVTSPTLTYQIKSLLAELPNAKWHQYEPAASDSVREGSRMAFGQYTNAVYRFDKADVIVSLDADFLSCGAASVRYAHDFADRRRLNEEKRDMNRLYVIESSVTLTGTVADHRLPVKPSEVEAVARVLAAKLGVAGAGSASTPHDGWVNAVANDLRGKRGAGLVIAGDTQPPVVHALAHAINQTLGNAGSTVLYTDPIEGNPADCNASIRELAADMDAGRVDTLLILGGNPVFTAPADLGFGEKLKDKVRLRIHLTSHVNETAELCQWQINEAHYLESWSDARAFDGTAAIIQPLIAPLYNGKTAHEVVAAFTNQPDRRSFDIVRDYWMRWMAAGGQEPPTTVLRAVAATNQASASGASPAQAVANRAAANAQAGQSAAPPAAPPTPLPPAVDAARFEATWRKWLHDGVVPNSAAKPKTVAAGASLPAPTAPASSGYEVVFKPDPTIYDGRYANNGWLQELPKPISKLTWDNVIYVSPKTAAELDIGKIKDGIAHNDTGWTGGDFYTDMIELTLNGRQLVMPAWIQPGHPDGVFTVFYGYGRRRVGRVGEGTGFNAYVLRASDAPMFATGVKVRKTGDTYRLAATQLHHMVDVSGVMGKDTPDLAARDVIRSGTLEEWKQNPSLNREEYEAKQPGHAGGKPDLEGQRRPTTFPEYDYTKGYRWSMSIDVNSCVGCSACVVACNAENNIPVVGKEQVMRSREMHWLRVDSYYRGDEVNPETYYQPVPCQQCEKAPCEVVCPVGATVHSAEGLNDMVYNRCVGTRYCSNNCPYKVRVFNWFSWEWPEPLNWQLNPDVAVREKGVMEKCTFCVQRIREAQNNARVQDRAVVDGEITPACAQTCPGDAIVFGNVKDPNSRVARAAASGRGYRVFEALNTQSAITYLKKVELDG
ncbi:MAG TPA: TAT-variant-translocated molybdopterin oxidoreductase [Blastocatellia bacterium]|nr:TAT-variant-translocated molybdopterin oxidoreductase [Blastocatellia bacterium]